MREGCLAAPTLPSTGISFTTGIYPDREGFSFWQDEICRHLSPSATERIDHEHAFAASLRQIVVGRTSVCDIAFSPMRNRRDGTCLRRMPDDDFFVAVMRSGTGKLDQCGRSSVLSPGDVVLYDSARPFEWRFDEACRMVVARIRRQDMVVRLPEIAELISRPIRATHPLASIVAGTIGELTRLEEPMTDSSSRRLGTAMVDLVTSSVEVCLARTSDRAGDRDVLRRAKAFLLANIDEPDLDLERLTRHLAVSRRTLCRLFAKDGTTPIRWLWRRRLELAFTLLSEGKADHVSQIAMMCGFSDFSHFSRAFKSAYGRTPRSLLNDAGSASGERVGH